MPDSTCKIIFIGTPHFSVPALEMLINNGHTVVAVITAPDRKSGRGMKITPSPVKVCAEQYGIDVLQPTNLKNASFIEELRSYNADLQIVIAFRMLPEIVWNMPPLGTINLHASMLPNYRGAAPINWAIINGEKSTGLTTFKLKHKIDTGNILLQEKMAINKNENAGSLHDRMSQKGADLMLKTVDGLLENTIQEKEQTFLPEFKSAPKIFKEDCSIDWNQTAEQVHNKVRGLSPYPASFTMLQDKVLKIFKTEFQQEDHSFIPGSYDTDAKSHLTFYTLDGNVKLLEVQLQGKKRMNIQSFLAGYKWI